MSETRLTPVTGTKRLNQLDVLRGFALFGILLVNFEFFLNPIQSIVMGHDGPVASAADAVSWGIQALAEGKFYALFSMLFGAGFALMLDRARQRQTGFWAVYLRRLLILLGMGLLHMLYVWSGDILVVYALVAFIMILFFRNTPVRRQWKWAVAFLLVPMLLVWLFVGSMAFAPPEAVNAMNEQFAGDMARQEQVVDSARAVQLTGSWQDMVSQRKQDFAFLLQNLFFWVPPILGYFLLGRWLTGSGRLSEPETHAGFYRQARLWGLLLGLPLSVLGTWLLWDQELMVMTTDLALGMTAMGIGAPVLAMGYLALVVGNHERLWWLAPAGRMALTNYLTQSLFWTWAIYGHGLNLGTVIPYWVTPVIVTAFFALQILFSHWWLSRYRFGPAEWIWRTLTYLKPQPMRR